MTKIRRVMDKAVAGLAGPDKRMATVFLCTIQNQTCVSAEYTDRKRQASYSGDRYRQVIAWPESEDAKKHWARYIEIRQDGMRSEEDIDGRSAQAYLKEHWAVMHEGTVLANPHRFVTDPGQDGEPLELSPLEHIYNVAADRGWDTVDCEYQNAPKDEDQASGIPKPEVIAKRLTVAGRWVVPAKTQKVTVGIDVGDYGLWWTVGAWWTHFAGQVIAYGCWPEQSRRFFTKAELTPTIKDVYAQVHGAEAAGDAMIFWALGQLVDYLADQPLVTETGERHRIARIGVDSGHEYNAVQQFAQNYRVPNLVLPTKGFGLAVKNKPMSMWAKTPGTIDGWNSRIARTQERREILVEFDANRWKAKLHGLLALPMGSSGALTLYGGERVDHRQIADHLTAERRVYIEAAGRKGFEYEPKVGVHDNDWLDSTTIAAVLAGFEGIKDATDGTPQKPARRTNRQRVSYLNT
ncbi:Phage terminase large subunit (GpA) [Planctomyces sp. SH-PL14]|nr:Phage terminase large subunit (GpA) [Planctomyces sp. SH-PL14]